MQLAFQTTVLGLIIGGIYGLLGAGLTLIFGVMRVVNFAHGAFAMVGGYASYYVAASAGLPAAAGLAAAIAIGAASGYFTDAVLLRAVHTGRVDRPGEHTLILTFGLALLLTAGAAVLFGADYKSVPGFWGSTLHVGWLRLTGDRVVAFTVALALTVGLSWVVYRTDLGRAWRAVTQSPVGARVVGVDVARLTHLAWATAGALAATAGALLAPLYTVYPSSGDAALVKGFVVVVLGGLGSITGALLAGALVGVVEAFGAVYGDAAYTDAYGFALMILVLLIVPTGLFGREVREL